MAHFAVPVIPPPAEKPVALYDGRRTLQSPSVLEPSDSVVAPAAHLLQDAGAPNPDLYSPGGHLAMTPGALEK